nr:NBS-containing resistance-like protein [Tanacetum cinerariifolium]
MTNRRDLRDLEIATQGRRIRELERLLAHARLDDFRDADRDEEESEGSDIDSTESNDEEDENRWGVHCPNIDRHYRPGHYNSSQNLGVKVDVPNFEECVMTTSMNICGFTNVIDVDIMSIEKLVSYLFLVSYNSVTMVVSTINENPSTSNGTPLVLNEETKRIHGTNVGWKVYKKAILAKFGNVYEDPMSELKNLKYETTAREYEDAFDSLLSRVEVSEEHAVSLFMGGLPTEIEMWLTTLGDIRFNFHELRMDFKYNNKRVLLRGTHKSNLDWLSTKALSKTVKLADLHSMVMMNEADIAKTSFRTHEIVEDHALHLKIVLDIIRHHKLYDNRIKYVFRTDKVEHLGNVIFAKGVATDPSKAKAQSNLEPKPIRKTHGSRSCDSQMHNNIMIAGSRDRPPMLATRRYAQWQSRFMRYVDTKPNGDAFRKSILEGPYKLSTITILEAIYLILTGIEDEIYLTVDACKIAYEMWIAIKRLQQGESLNKQDVKTSLFWEFGIFTSRDGETIDTYYSRFYKMMNDLETDEEVDKQELKAHYMYMKKIQEVPTTDSGPSFDAEPLEEVHSNDDYNVFANEKQHSEQPVSIDNTCVVEKALLWHSQFVRIHGTNVGWEVYKKAILARFGNVYADPMYELKNLKYETTTREYEDASDSLLSRVEVSEEHAVSLFMGGLPTEIEMGVRMTSGLVISSFDVIVLEISIPSPNRQQSILLSSSQALPHGTNTLVIPGTKCYGLLLLINLFRARLVASGSSQQLGIDCDETFSPVVKPATIRTVLSLAVSRKWPIHQLDKSLYGLKQAPRAWFQRFAGYATRVGFYHSRCDSSLFILRQGSQVAYLLIYVDEIILIASSTYLLQQVITSLHNEFDMTDLGALNYFLGISTTRHSTGLFLSQKLLPLNKAVYFSLLCFLGDNLLSWSFKRQQTISRSSAEAEYRGVANVVAETRWLRNLLRELHSPLSAATLVYCNNFSATYLSANPVQHQRTKHIEIDIHFVRDLVTAGQVRVLYMPSRYQYADIFTKGLPSALFEDFRSSLSIRLPPVRTAGAY